MGAEQTCPKCGTLLPSDALEGLCPKCVGRVAFERSPRSLPAREDGGDIAEPQLSTDVESELARLKPEDVGERIGNYKLIEQIGQGGFGTGTPSCSATRMFDGLRSRWMMPF